MTWLDLTLLHLIILFYSILFYSCDTLKCLLHLIIYSILYCDTLKCLLHLIIIFYSVLFYYCDTLKCLLHLIILFYSILYILWYSRNRLNSTQPRHSHNTERYALFLISTMLHRVFLKQKAEFYLCLPLFPNSCLVFSLFILSRIITIFVSFHLSTLFICPFFSSLYPSLCILYSSIDKQ